MNFQLFTYIAIQYLPAYMIFQHHSTLLILSFLFLPRDKHQKHAQYVYFYKPAEIHGWKTVSLKEAGNKKISVEYF